MKVLKVLVGFVVAMVALVLSATPASAHSSGGVQATNYKSVLETFGPSVSGIQLKLEDLGNRVRVTNSNDSELTVLGYSGEPYLRVSSHGVFTNVNSPAYFVNQSTSNSNYVPGGVAPSEAPKWKKTGSGDSVSWHDHRVHWMSSVTPAVIRAEPNKTHLVIPEWTVNMQYEGQALTAQGHLSWLPASSPVPWYALATILFAVGLGLGLGTRGATVRGRSVLTGAVLLLVFFDVVHSLGMDLSTSGSVFQTLGKSLTTLLPSVVGWFTSIYGVRRLMEDQEDGPWFCLFGVCVTTVLGGLSDLATLDRSQLPFIGPQWLDRLAVVVSTGLGLALVVGFLAMLRGQRKAMASLGQ